MQNNDVLRRLRFALQLPDIQMGTLFRIGGNPVKPEDIPSLLAREDDEGYTECSNLLMRSFLDGLIMEKRGPKPDSDDARRRSIESNNDILKAVRVALAFKEEDMLDCFAKAAYPISGGELRALFRKRGQKNYKLCGDQVLRNFLRGLTLKLRPDTANRPELQ